ncbi:MAG: DnaJ C-terminal domain-containing protein, partial [Bacteroidales bacterium]
DIFGGHFGGGFSDFGGFGGGRSRKHVNRGTDLRVKVKLTLKEIATGVEKKIRVKKYVSCKVCNGTGAENGTAYTTCTTCNGSGMVTRVQQTFLGAMQSTGTCPVCNGEGKTITKKCPACNGEGILREDEVITLNIPAGVIEGMQLSMSGKGNAARHGGVNGDLLVVIEEEEHTELLRDENDLIYNALLDFPTAALGGSVEIPTIDGKVKVKIEPGTQPGKVLRLRGKGLPSINRYGVGDLLVNVSIYIPENLNAEERKTMEKLVGQTNFTPTKAIKERIFSRLKRMFD